MHSSVWRREQSKEDRQRERVIVGICNICHNITEWYFMIENRNWLHFSQRLWNQNATSALEFIFLQKNDSASGFNNRWYSRIGFSLPMNTQKWWYFSWIRFIWIIFCIFWIWIQQHQKQHMKYFCRVSEIGICVQLILK